MFVLHAILTDTRVQLPIQNIMDKPWAALCVFNGSKARPWQCKAFGNTAFSKGIAHILLLKIEFSALAFTVRLRATLSNTTWLWSHTRHSRRHDTTFSNALCWGRSAHLWILACTQFYVQSPWKRRFTRGALQSNQSRRYPHPNRQCGFEGRPNGGSGSPPSEKNGD